MSTTRTPAEIVARLNAYHGDSVWQEEILLLSDYDEDATCQVDVSGRSDRFVLTDGTMIEWIESADDDRHWCIHPSGADERWAMITDLNEPLPDGRVVDLVGIFRNHVMIDCFQVETSEDRAPYDAALVEEGYAEIPWIPGQF